MCCIAMFYNATFYKSALCTYICSASHIIFLRSYFILYSTDSFYSLAGKKLKWDKIDGLECRVCMSLRW